MQINQQKNFDVDIHQGGPIKDVAPVKNCPLRPSLQPLPSSPHGMARLYQYSESKELLHIFCSSSSLLSLMAFTLNCTQTENRRASKIRVKANVCRCKVSAGQLLLSVQFFNCPFYFSPLRSNVAAPPSPCRWLDFICHHSPFHSTHRTHRILALIRFGLALTTCC